jgi:hypothetical protein
MEQIITFAWQDTPGCSDNIAVHCHRLKSTVNGQYQRKSTQHGKTGAFFFFSASEIHLPPGWKTMMPQADHLWVSRALFTLNASGKPKLDQDHPVMVPSPSAATNRQPDPESKPLLRATPSAVDAETSVEREVHLSH